MLKVTTNDIEIDGLLWLEDFFQFDVLSWQRTNTLGTGVSFEYSYLDSLPYDLFGKVDGFRVMTESQRSAVENVIAMFETFIDVQFTEVEDYEGYDIGFATGGLNPDALTTSGLTYNYIDYDYFATFGYFDKSEVFLANDIPRDEFDDPQPNDFSYLVIIHELGHALGLEHPFEGIILPEDIDTTRFTMMSYTDGFEQFEEPRTLMPLDIQALQYLYGANMDHNSDDTLYDLAEFEQNSIQTIWDAGGVDTVSLENLSERGPYSTNGTYEHYVDLTVGFDTGAKVYTSGGMILENVVGSDYRDWILGNAADNVITSGAGNDVVNAGGGNDTVEGGTGRDTLSNPDGDGDLFGEGGNDTLIALNAGSMLSGGGGNDILLGGRADDRLLGGAGQDFIVGDTSNFFHGDDVINGGSGNDKLMGAGGADTFVFGTADGNNTIAQFDLSSQSQTGADFTPGEDLIQLIGFDFGNTTEVLDHIRAVGADAVFDHPDHQTIIRFVGVDAADLTADSFILAI